MWSVEQNVHIFKLKALRSPKRTDEIQLFHAVVARTSCSDLSFQSSCWPSCCISYAIWKVLRFSACKKEHNASNIPLKLGHANLWSTYSPLQRYELFMKLPTFSCYFFIIYIHFFFESFVFFRKSDYLCHRKQIIQLSQVEGIKGIKGEKGA